MKIELDDSITIIQTLFEYRSDEEYLEMVKTLATQLDNFLMDVNNCVDAMIEQTFTIIYCEEFHAITIESGRFFVFIEGQSGIDAFMRSVRDLRNDIESLLINV